MKNVKRILALIAAFLLFGMYLCTFIFALSGSPHSTDLLWVSVISTVVIPVLLYGYLLVYRLTHPSDQEDPHNISHDQASDDTI